MNMKIEQQKLPSLRKKENRLIETEQILGDLWDHNKRPMIIGVLKREKKNKVLLNNCPKKKKAEKEPNLEKDKNLQIQKAD